MEILTWTSEAFFERVFFFNNLAFKSTLVNLSITKSTFGFLVRPKEQKENLVSLKVDFVLQSAPFSVPRTFLFPLGTVVVPLPDQYHLLAVSFLCFSALFNKVDIQF